MLEEKSKTRMEEMQGTTPAATNPDPSPETPSNSTPAETKLETNA